MNLERLEDRLLMHADTNTDGQLTPADALGVINHLVRDTASFDRSLDVNDDGQVTALDALQVINRLGDEHAHTVYVKFGKLDTANLSESEVRWAIFSAFDRIESIASVDIRLTTGNDAAFSISSSRLIVGGQHVRGAYYPQSVRYHDGSGLGGATAFSNPDSLRRIIQHEIGHWMGMGHTPNRSCIMHAAASGLEWCATERTSILNRWGPT